MDRMSQRGVEVGANPTPGAKPLVRFTGDVRRINRKALSMTHTSFSNQLAR